MNEIVFLQNEEAMTDSLRVAELFGKRHDRVLRSIEELKKNSSPQNWGQCFHQSSYKDASGKMSKKYLMNRDGFSMLAMGFTGKKAIDWKWKFVEAFNKMEAVLQERQSTSWIEARERGKLTRKAETDMIANLVEYAKEQGSQHSKMLYMIYSRLANKMCGIKNRDTASTYQLCNLVVIENAIQHEIEAGIVADKHYKQIYQDCKARLEIIKELAYIE